MGVLIQSSCLMIADRQDIGLALASISDGKEADLGVWRGGRTGLVVAGMVREG